ncbi:hypothetical protein D6777_02385 [Candidatus Woesearchaeota archaeon]|nr:MAG: hypothetical protein D6777_02385 [Candidatus Woesearchaeota archaeon]
MKWSTILTLIIFLVALTITGCQPSESSEMQDVTVNQVKVAEQVEEPELPQEGVIEDVTKEPVEETEQPAEIEEIDEAPVEVVEQPQEAEQVEEVEQVEETEQPIEGPKTFYLGLNKPVTFKGKSIEMTKYFDATFIEFKVGNTLSRFRETKRSEIVEGLRVTYLRSLYTSNGSIEVQVEEFNLGPNEYLLNKKEYASVNGHQVRLDSIKYDSTIADGVAWVSLVNEAGSSIRIKRGETKNLDDLKVTLIEPFWLSGKEYAHLKIE